MKRWLLCCALLLSTSAQAQSKQAPVKCVLDSYNPLELLACQKQEMGVAFDQMTKAYIRLNQVAPAEARPALADSQVKWAAYRDASCKAIAASPLNKAMPGVAHGTCLLDMTQARKAWLIQSLDAF